jgi:hypothetical protein
MQMQPCPDCGAMSWSLRQAADGAGVQLWCQSCGEVRPDIIEIPGGPILRDAPGGPYSGTKIENIDVDALS